MTIKDFVPDVFETRAQEEACIKAMIEFAQYHVGQTKEQIKKEIVLIYNTPEEFKISDENKFNIRYDSYIEIESINGAYPLENIK